MIIAIIILCLVLAFLFYASYSIQAGIYMKALCRIQTKEKIVMLTFDDGPDAVQTPKILDILKEYGVTAIFFCIGSKIEGNEELLRRMIAEGHTLGNHSYIHTWKFPFYSERKMKADLLNCQEQLEYAIKQQVRLFRPPFGVTNPTISNVVKKLGYQTIGWNIRTLDTQSLSHEKIMQHIKRKLRPGSIILLHDRMPESAELLKLILRELKLREYCVVNPLRT